MKRPAEAGDSGQAATYSIARAKVCPHADECRHWEVLPGHTDVAARRYCYQWLPRHVLAEMLAEATP